MKIFGKELKFNGKRVYHENDKPTPSEIGAAAASHGTHVTYSTTAPLANGTASAGSASTVARTDHVHPLQTTVSGNAGTATKLATARTISITGDATGSASFDGSANASISTTLANSGVTSGSYGQSANATASFGGTFTVPQVTVDAKGRVTSASNRTITMPSNPNSDTKVTNTLATTTKAYITGTTSNTTNTGTQVFDTGVYLDTTAGTLTATTFKGALEGNAKTATTATTCTGNSATATKATQDSAGQQINTTYVKGLSVSGKTITYTKGDGSTGTITTQDTDTHYTAKNIVGASNTATANATSSNGSTYINLIENGAVRSTHKITGSGATTVSSDASGNITISSTNTNTTYSAGTGMALSGTTFNHSNSVTAGTAQGDASKTLTWGGTFTIPTVTYDAQGHITSKGTTTMTMPSNPNSDTKVTNTLNTTTKAYITGTTSSSTNTGTQIFDTDVYLDSTAGMLTATTFKGALSGNASTATKLATARTISLGGILSGSASFDGSGNVTISASANDITSITKSLKVTTDWMDTGISGTNLSTGTYAVQMLVNDGENTSQWSERYSGIMSWHAESTNSTEADEILLHKAGHAPNGRHTYLRTLRQSSGVLKLQISSTHNFSATSNIVFKFKKLI